ncbi:alpha/beta hydrolase [Glaciecola petra]|uniref:Alpha/beta hydrolase n=1 Tax=Glaciecola petra TaxID=3075602 RepID=A0ABU2ZMU5_9ALTE|nr:alpha/beta hydrolase [Aestuariibacter sp. P117]MDT0593938.1 alpha/beta hydrolase [Aestuariibacter sp. P117]
MIKESIVALPHTKLATLQNDLTNADTTLIFVHGYLDNANSFLPMLPFFTDVNWIAVDFAGHGKSQHRSSDAHYHLLDYVFDLASLIEHLALSNVVLVGHSLGAIVSSIVASTQASYLKGFIAIESMGPLSEPEHTSAQQISASIQSRFKAQKAIRQPNSLKDIVKARCGVSDLNPHNAELIMRRNLNINADGSVEWRSDKRLRTLSPLRLTEGQALNILDSITCPRAVILGDQGFEKVKAGIDKRKAQFKGVPLYTFAGGHHVHMDSAKEIALKINTIINNY